MYNLFYCKHRKTTWKPLTACIQITLTMGGVYENKENEIGKKSVASTDVSGMWTSSGTLKHIGENTDYTMLLNTSICYASSSWMKICLYIDVIDVHVKFQVKYFWDKF